MNPQCSETEHGVNDPHGKILKMDPKGGSHSYPDIPEDAPGLTGGPAAEAVTGAHRHDPLDVMGSPKALAVPLSEDEDDGGEGVLSGLPRETGGERPESGT